jgi:Flp pilus assembly pilin Flp
VARLIKRFFASEEGAGLIEYGLLLGLIATGLLGVMTLYRNALGGSVARSSANISQATAGGYGGGYGGGGGHAGPISVGPVASGAPSAEPEPEPDDSSATGETAGRNMPFDTAVQ